VIKKKSVLCDKSGRCALHLDAQYSESLELVQDVLCIDQKMTQKLFEVEGTEKLCTPLGLLCRRPYFSTFEKIFLCLTEADSTVEVILDGIIRCLGSCKNCFHQDMLPGSSNERNLILLGNLLIANPTVTKYNNWSIFFAAACLKGELGVSVLNLFLSKDSNGVKAIYEGLLPIHWAACYSCLNVMKFLHKAYPESIALLGSNARSLLHMAAFDENSDVADVKVQYLCDQCPALIHLKDGEGDTALHDLLIYDDGFNSDCVKTLCNADPSVVKDKCTPLDTTELSSGQLPLHSLIEFRSQFSELSIEGDCFRLLLRLYPAAAGIKDGHSRSPYDIAMSDHLSTYFIRLLLSADPAIDPIRRHNLNFAARRQGMFLAFRALSSDVEPTIWTKMRLKGRDLVEHVISYL
jgi:hypothetical protein